MFNTLSIDDFKEFAFKFEDSGFEVYEVWEKDYVERFNADDERPREVADTLRARELFEKLRSKWFDLTEESAEFDPKQRASIRLNWVDGLTKAIGPFLRATARAVLSKDYWEGTLEDL